MANMQLALAQSPEIRPIEAYRSLAVECVSLLKRCAEHIAEADDALQQSRMAEAIFARFAKKLGSPDVKLGEKWNENAAQNVAKSLEVLRAKARKLQEKKKILKGLYGTARFNKWLLMCEQEYRGYFAKSAQDLEKVLSNFRVLSGLDIKYTTFDSCMYIVNEEARRFWKEAWTSEYWRVGWDRFSKVLVKLMEMQGIGPNQEELSRLKYVLTVGVGENLSTSCFVFNQTVQKYGFPFELNNVPERPHREPEKLEWSLGERLLVSREVAELTASFSQPDMTVAIREVMEYMRSEGADACDKWAVCLRDAENAEGDEEVKHAVKIDEYRRRWTYFFVRFMMLWRIGHVTQELFTDLDFPGELRITQFIRHVEPLDEAHCRVLMGGEDKNEWERRRPKLYSFLRLLLWEIRTPEKDIPPPFPYQGTRMLPAIAMGMSD